MEEDHVALTMPAVPLATMVSVSLFATADTTSGEEEGPVTTVEEGGAREIVPSTPAPSAASSTISTTNEGAAGAADGDATGEGIPPSRPPVADDGPPDGTLVGGLVRCRILAQASLQHFRATLYI